MKTFVTGKFSTLKNATQAVEKLHRACISRDRVCTVLLGPSRRRQPRPAASTGNLPWLLKDNDCEPDRNAQTGMDANSALYNLEQRSADRTDGVLVAVVTPDRVSRVLAVSVLRDYGAYLVTSKANFTPNKN